MNMNPGEDRRQYRIKGQKLNYCRDLIDRVRL
jgi:hypothetical protein